MNDPGRTPMTGGPTISVAYERGRTVRVVVELPGESYTWVGRIMAHLDAATFSVRCLGGGISSHAVGELVDVDRSQLQPVNAYTAGDLAYYDAFHGGLVPCKVLEVRRADQHCELRRTVVVVRLTAGRHAWKRGEVLESDDLDVIPRASVFTRDRRLMIRNNYAWLPAEVLA